MNKNLYLSLVVFLLYLQGASAQDLHFTPFDDAPMMLNPAFTGMFDGNVRASTIYRNEWSSITVPYVTLATSVDMPLYTDKHGDYLAGGIMIIQDQVGDGNFGNFTTMFSLAYHKLFNAYSKEKKKKSELAIGLQAGYAQKKIDLSPQYFGYEYYTPYTLQYNFRDDNGVNYYMINAGISFAQSLTPHFNYVVGISGNNLNQPSNYSVKDRESEQVGFDMQYALTVGANWQVAKRLSLCPAFMYETTTTLSNLNNASNGMENVVIVGNEFRYALGKDPGRSSFVRSVFLAGWYRSGQLATITAGTQLKSFRIGLGCDLGYDYNTPPFFASPFYNPGGGNRIVTDALEIQLKYIAPSIHKRVIPCDRF